MAGVKGRSGGCRPGAGRKPDPKPEPVPQEETDMLKLLTDIARGLVDATPMQVRAAIAAVQYTHTKRGDGGKKEEAAAKSAVAAAGKFKSSAPPKLTAVK